MTCLGKRASACEKTELLRPKLASLVLVKLHQTGCTCSMAVLRVLTEVIQQQVWVRGKMVDLATKKLKAA